MNDDDENSTLPPHILERVDDAFNKASGTGGQKASALNSASIAAGGFLVDDTTDTGGGFLLDDTADTGGGFLLDESQAEAADNLFPPTHIPLSRIPYALDLLNLPQDDPDILNVFNNAADGWGGETSTRNKGKGRAGDDDEAKEEKYVSRSDWRAVCSALIPPSELEHGTGFVANGDSDANAHMEVDDDGRVVAGNGSESSLSELSDAYEDTDDEYQDVAQPRKRVRLSLTAKGKGKAKAKAQDSDSGFSSPVVSGKKSSKTRKSAKSTRTEHEIEEACVEAFKLFFPASSAAQTDTGGSKGDKASVVCRDCGAMGHTSLPHCRLTIDDVVRAMRSVGEKFTVGDVS